MKLLKVVLVDVLAMSLSLVNIELKHLVLAEFRKLSVKEREVILDHYKVSTIYQLLLNFRFVTDADLRKLFDNYKVNQDFGLGSVELEKGLTFKKFKQALALHGIKKGELYLRDFDHKFFSMVINKFISNNLDRVKNVNLLVDADSFAKQKGQIILDGLVSSGKLTLMELN